MRRAWRWWRDPANTKTSALWEARFWVAVAVAGVFIRPLRESIPVLFFLSAYANAKAARAEAEAAT